jgi:hypothetical protein
MGVALSQELQHDSNLGVGCAKGRSDVGVAGTGADL